MSGDRKIRLSHRAEDLALRLVTFALGPIGWRGTQRLGGALGVAAYRLTGIRAGVTKENIRRCFGGALDESDVDRLALDTYRNWGRTFLEFARFGAMRPEELRSIVHIEGKEFLDEALRAGKGAVLFTGHFGNFDLFGAAVAAHGYPLSVLVQRQSNVLVDERVRRNRERMGLRVIYRGAGVREIVRAFRRNEFVAIVGDQDARDAGIFVDFLGTPASTPKGAAVFSHRYDVPIIFGTLERREDGTHLARFESPITPRRDAPEEGETLRLTQETAARLEAAVRRRPDHYFWMHRRWKTKPPSGGIEA